MKLKNILAWIGILAFGLGIGYYFGFKADLFTKHESSSATVVMERINQVFKLVSVEGQTSEIYDYKSYNTYDISPLRKKILIRVNAKVLVGYDLEKAKIETNSGNKTITISELPSPEILSIEHDLDYYDLQEGTFNKFSADELTQLNKNAKEYAASKALTDELYHSAEAQKKEHLAILKDLLKGIGWKLIVKEDKPLLID